MPITSCILRWMTLFFLMNASDLHLQMVPGGYSHFIKGVISNKSIYRTIFNGVSNELVMLLSEIFWWIHMRVFWYL
jgi:hypothetical protein